MTAPGPQLIVSEFMTTMTVALSELHDISTWYRKRLWRLNAMPQSKDSASASFFKENKNGGGN